MQPDTKKPLVSFPGPRGRIPKHICQVPAFPSLPLGPTVAPPRTKHQVDSTYAGGWTLDYEDNSLWVFPNFLSEMDLKAYVTAASTVTRAINDLKHARTSDSRSFVRYYTGSKQVPAHVNDLAFRVRQRIPGINGLSFVADHLFGATHAGGGGLWEHSEVGKQTVVLFSLGQTRYLRLREKRFRAKDEKRANYLASVALSHNTVVILHGDTFQRNYKMSMEKFADQDQASTHHLLKLCYDRFEPIELMNPEAEHEPDISGLMDLEF